MEWLYIFILKKINYLSIRILKFLQTHNKNVNESARNNLSYDLATRSVAYK